MANLDVQPGWPAVRQLEALELARGGPNGNLNEQAKALAARTEFLNQEKASKSEIVQGIHEFDTYALFNAAKATLPLNCTVVIGEKNTTGTGQWDQGNNSWNGTILKKSSHDPLMQAKATTKEITDVVDVSVISGNYKLTFAEAITYVPEFLKKRFLTIKYNQLEIRTFINDDLTNFSNERYWIRKTEVYAEGVNQIQESMIYHGFIIDGVRTAAFNNYNACMIIPIRRTYDENNVERKLNLLAFPVALKSTTMGFLDEKGVRVSAITNTQFSNYTIPASAAYAFINLEWDTSGTIVNEGNIEIAKNYLIYVPNNSSESVASAFDGFDTVEHSFKSGLFLDYSREGIKLTQPYFASHMGTVNGLHIAQIVKYVEVQKGQRSLRKPDGALRKFWVWSVEKTSDQKLKVEFKGEQEDGFETITYPITSDINGAIVNVEYVARYKDYDSARVKIVVDVRNLPVRKITFGYNGEIASSIVEQADRVRNVNKGLQITQFSDYGVSSVDSNMSLPAANTINVTRKMVNGFAYNEVTGDQAKDHQQATLIASKYSNFFGAANLYMHVDTLHTSQPKIKVLNEKSSIDSMPILSSGRILNGRKDSQYIHPDICYSETPIAGYKYWMINSNFPYGSDIKEDADLFVSNDGQNWTRVRGAYESSNGGVGFKLPSVPWNTDYPNAFFPIPINGNTFEFAKENVIENGTITKYLAHDPCIACHDGYVLVYVIYNLALTGTVYQHKYTVCYRTNNGSDWEIVREDGSTMPFNAENAMKIFSKTGNVRNHHRYVYRSTGASDIGFAPQIVKVSDTEWYVYNRENNLVPSTGQTMGLARFRGSSPYTIDYSAKEIVSKNDSKGGNLWHFGARYYNGVFYILTNGFMFTSTDGLNFTTVQYPFFWRGMSSDLYKPSFVVGHDGKVKIVYGIQCLLASPHAYAPQTTVSPAPFNKIFNGFKLCATLICEYPSLADIVARGSAPVADAYADVVVQVVSQREKTTGIYILPALREFSELEGINVSYDDEVYAVAYLNTRNGGKLNFGGLALTLPNSAQW